MKPQTKGFRFMAAPSTVHEALPSVFIKNSIGKFTFDMILVNAFIYIFHVTLYQCFINSQNRVYKGDNRTLNVDTRKGNKGVHLTSR